MHAFTKPNETKCREASKNCKTQCIHQYNCQESGRLSPLYNCTSPMDCISHHALHSHIPIHHYTNHTAVTIHSSTLIVLPHLHLIHSPTYKQHTSLHTLRSLVLPWLTFPSVFPSVSICVLPGLLTLSLLIVCCLPH